MKAVFLCTFFIASFGQDYTCTWNNNGDIYDLSDLRNDAEDYSDTQPDKHTYLMNVCQAIVDTTHCTQPGTAACQYQGNNNYYLGLTSAASIAPLATAGQLGMQVTFMNGQGDTTKRKTVVSFICDCTTRAALSYISEDPSLVYNFNFRSFIACPTNQPCAPTPPPPGPPPGPPGSPSSAESEGIGGGTIFIIVLICLAAVYLVAGVAFNHFAKHNAGLELIPNLSFWADLPSLVKDGCLYIWSKFSTVILRRGYSSV